MEDMKLDRKAIGMRIGQVRRRAGISQTEFARALHTPVMTVEIAEHGVRQVDGASHETLLLSVEELIRLLKRLSRIFNIPLDWLIYGTGAVPELDPFIQPSGEELTLYLPVTISGQGLVDEMNKALILASANSNRHEELADLQQEALYSVIQKQRLYEQYAAYSGITPCARLARKRMLNAVEKARKSGVRM